jgi:uncharacterized protein YjbJ (UPF0337 family)
MLNPFNQQNDLGGVIPWAQNSVGFDRLLSVLDPSNPEIKQWLDNTYYSNTGWDTFSPWGDQFSTALMGLSLATGGAAAFGAFAPAAGAGAAGTAAAGAPGVATGAADVVAPITLQAGANIAATPLTLAPEGFGALAPAAGAVGPGAGSALVPEFEGGTFAATGPSTFSTGGQTLFDLAKTASPYISGAGTVTKTAGQVTGNKELEQAGTALTYAGAATGGAGNAGSGTWGAGDLLKAGSTALGAANSLSGQGDTRSTSSSEPSEEVRKLLAVAARQQFPQRYSGFLEALNAFQRRAEGSPLAL